MRDPSVNWFVALIDNQSLAGIWTRWFQFGVSAGGDGLQLRPLSSGELLWLKVLIYTSGLALAAITAWRFGRPLRSAPTLSRVCGQSVPLGQVRTGMEAAAVLCMMLLLSPISHKSHFVVTLLPCLLLARLAIEQRRAWVWGLVGPLLLLGLLTSKDLIGRSWGDATMLWSLPTWFVLTLLVGMWIALGEARVRSTVLRVEPAPTNMRSAA